MSFNLKLYARVFQIDAVKESNTNLFLSVVVTSHGVFWRENLAVPRQRSLSAVTPLVRSLSVVTPPPRLPSS